MKRKADRSRGVMDALLELRLELSLLNHRIAAENGLNDIDLDCLEVLSRRGPTTPARLGRRLGIHPATMTGILSRLVASGWIDRSADPEDGRASRLAISPDRDARLRKRYEGASRAVVEAMGVRSKAEVAVLVEALGDLASRMRALD